MNRVAVVATLLISLTAQGCALRQQTSLVPSEDSGQLVAAIAQKGQDERYVSTAPPGSYLLSDCLKVMVNVTGGVVLLAVLAACASAGGGSFPFPNFPNLASQL